MFYSPSTTDTPPQERTFAHAHFFLPHRYRDPFHTNAVSTESFVTYDGYDLLMVETRDALGNRLTVGERNVDPTQPLVRHGHDYRVLQPALMMDPNRNRSTVAACVWHSQMTMTPQPRRRSARCTRWSRAAFRLILATQ